MNSRLELQLKKIARVLPLLAHAHVPVYEIRLNANWVRPVLRTGAGPYAWHGIAMGLDDQGQWTEYVAHLHGVELQRRVRSGRHPRPSTPWAAREGAP